MGNVGKEPTYHTMKSGELCKFSIATKRVWRNKDSGERMEDTSWHNIVIFNPHLVEKVCRVFIQKGTRVYLEGEIKTRSYEKDGETKWITEIIIPQVKGELIVIAKGKGWDTNETPGSERRGGGGGPQHAGAAARRATGGGPDDFDDDIPF